VCVCVCVCVCVVIMTVCVIRCFLFSPTQLERPLRGLSLTRSVFSVVVVVVCVCVACGVCVAYVLGDHVYQISVAYAHECRQGVWGYVRRVVGCCVYGL